MADTQNNETLDSENETDAAPEETAELTEAEETAGAYTDDVSTTEADADVEQLKATNKKLFERAKKAEFALKAAKALKVQTPAKPLSPHTSVEETVLLANGMDENLLEKLKKVAALNNTSLLKAQTDPIFIVVKDKFEKDKKREEASLPSSRANGGAKPKKDFRTPGLSAEEHKAMVKALG